MRLVGRSGPLLGGSAQLRGRRHGPRLQQQAQAPQGAQGPRQPGQAGLALLADRVNGGRGERAFPRGEGNPRVEEERVKDWLEIYIIIYSVYKSSNSDFIKCQLILILFNLPVWLHTFTLDYSVLHCAAAERDNRQLFTLFSY